MPYTIEEISKFIKGEALLAEPSAVIENLLIDSRKLVFPNTSLFFALKTELRDGAVFIEELYERGLRSFVVEENFNTAKYPESNFLKVESPLKALQTLASFHRSKFNYPIIGITGSNGKTVVKEWLYQLLHTDHNIVRSPKSYNSQIGVPLSCWQMNDQHSLAIFEAGISKPGEMENLQKIIQPTIGILTNIGEAHSEGFANAREKAAEKAKLFKDCKYVVYCKDVVVQGLFKGAQSSQTQYFTWSRHEEANLEIIEEVFDDSETQVTAIERSSGKELTIKVPFSDRISIDNAITCWCTMLLLGYENGEINNRMMHLSSVEMRMQLKRGVNNCTIINDSYSNDLSSLQLALDYLKQQQGGKKATVILSDILESGLKPSELFNSVVDHVSRRKIERLILIGPVFNNQKYGSIYANPSLANSIHKDFYPSTEAFLEHSNTHQFRDEVILLKGARKFEFESISRWLEEKVHQTVMEINLNAMVHNLKEYKKHLKPSTKVMAMVKAFSYGSGSAEVATVLQFNQVDYLAVAYADEGIELRKAGINMPVMVMNPEIITFDALVQYDLEPELYSFNILKAFDAYLQQQGIPAFPVHLKIDTGMHRLGFDSEQVDELSEVVKNNKRLVIKSVFTHLVGSEDEELDPFTSAQFHTFNKACDKISAAVKYPFIKHLSNSAAIFRHPALQCDMVRLGIGLYGVDSSGINELQLQPVATLTSTIAQVRKVKAGESVGYNRKGIVKRDSLIATVRLGYADGFSRRLSNGVGSVYINGAVAPVIGNVCMDMTMIDITGINGVNEGDKVEVFGPHLPVRQVAKAAGTIPYEIMTGISQRVKRVYYEE